MSTASHDWKGWAQSYLPVVSGHAPDDMVSLQALADSQRMAEMTSRLASRFEADARYSALTLLHYAVGAVTHLLIAPFALDGVTLDAAADQWGILMDETGSLRALWMGSRYGGAGNVCCVIGCMPEGYPRADCGSRASHRANRAARRQLGEVRCPRAWLPKAGTRSTRSARARLGRCLLPARRAVCAVGRVEKTLARVWG